MTMCCVTVFVQPCACVLCECVFHHATVCCVTVWLPSCDSVLSDVVVSVI